MRVDTTSFVQRHRDLLVGVAAAIAAVLFLQGSERVNAAAGGEQTPTPSGVFGPFVQCVGSDTGSPGQSIAVFGYENGTNASVTLPHGGFYNEVLLTDVGGAMTLGNITPYAGAPVDFVQGIHRNAFAVRFDPVNEAVRWTVYGTSATTTGILPSCDGEPGPPGEAGPAGPAGGTGPMGPMGNTGLAGPMGDPGPAGPRGLRWRGQWEPWAVYAEDDAVHLAGSAWMALGTSNGSLPGASPLWSLLASRGDPGPAGDPGPIGPAGNTGPMGPAGEVGPVGLTGPVGPAGPAGLAGPAGPAGLIGPTGPTGSAGAPGPMGLMGPAGPAGSGGIGFVRVEVATSGPLALPAGDESPVYMVTNPAGPAGRLLTLTLPPVADSTRRIITIRRANSRGRVVIGSANNEPLEGWRDQRLALQDRWDYFTLASDGATWFVIAHGR